MMQHPTGTPFPLRPLVAAVFAALSAALFTTPNHAQEAAKPVTTEGKTDNTASRQQPKTLDTVTVSAGSLSPKTEGKESYAPSVLDSATRLNLSVRDTPQSVSVITRTRLDDFRITDVNEALENTTGITVEQVETDRTYYTARGFDITNFQIDGVGMPFVYGNMSGDLDVAIYDRIDVLRGATGLLTGISDPSAAINFVRKRPTGPFQAAASVTLGTWDNRRVDADISGALNRQGSVRGRLVVAHQDKDSYLDRYNLKKSVVYGVIEADIGKNTILTAGHNFQKNDSTSPLWGALPLFNTSGEPTNYSRSTSSAANWSYWDGKKQGTFIEVAHAFDNDWQAKAILTRNKVTEDSRLFYVYGTPDPTTPGSDLFSYPSLYNFNNRQTIFDVYATGPFSLLGRKHELVLGASWSKSELVDVSQYGEDIGTEIPPLETWDGNYPIPAFTGGTDGSDTTDKQTSIYGAARLNLTDRLTTILGARVVNLDSSGTTYGQNRTKSYDNKVTPYAGLTYRLNDTYSLYGSYAKLFRPQFEVDVTGNRLDAVTGKSYEAGIKGEFLNKRLNASLAVFKTKQRNLAEPAGFSTFSYHTASDELSSAGYEAEIAGEVARGLQVAAGYTYLNIEDENNDAARTFIPRRLLRLSTSYRLPMMQQLKVGASVNWQDDISYTQETLASTGPSAGTPITTREKNYALLNLMARYDFTKNLSAAVNINNVTDEKYYQSLYWASFGQGFYGAPRNVNFTLSWKY